MAKSSSRQPICWRNRRADITANKAAKYLYTLLVSEGGFREALGAQAEDANVTLETDLSQEFRQRSLFGEQPDGAPHPIRRGAILLGSGALAHKPAFVQESAHLYVIESVDFTTVQKRRSKDHAGLAAYMFRDLRATRENVEPIAVIKVTEAETELPDVDYALKLLRNEDNVVNWLDQGQKQGFLRDRVEAAYA